MFSTRVEAAMSELSRDQADDAERLGEVKRWLRSIGMVRYYNELVAGGYDSMDVVMEVMYEEDDLLSIGITKPAHVKYLLKHAAQVRKGVWNPFDQVPDELVLHILGYLDTRDLMNARLVSRKWNVWCMQDQVWRGILLREMVYKMLASSQDAAQMVRGIRPSSRCKATFDPETMVADVLAQREDGQSWMALYIKCMGWRWDDRSIPPQIILADRGFRAIHSGPGTHHALRTSQGMSSGLHYFEVIVLGPPNDRFSHSIGLANSRFRQAWNEDNDGIGWYLNGNVYNRGLKMTAKFPTWGRGDRVGLLVDVDHGFMYFTKNGVPYNYRLSVRRDPWDSLYFGVLMGGSEAVFLRHGGPVVCQKLLSLLSDS